MVTFALLITLCGDWNLLVNLLLNLVNLIERFHYVYSGEGNIFNAYYTITLVCE